MTPGITVVITLPFTSAPPVQHAPFDYKIEG